MKFKKIDEKTVCCMLSEEDLIDNDITVEDFIHNKDKVQDFLEEIIQTAKEEVGFETTGHMLSIQIMGMPPDGVMITLSDEQKDLTKIMRNGLLGLKEEIEQEGWADSGPAAPKVRELLQELEAVTQKMSDGAKKKEVEETEEERIGLTIFRFADMKRVLDFVKYVPVRSGLESSLYKNPEKNEYYMVLAKKRISEERYHCVISTAIEFGEMIASEGIHLAYIKEHFPCLIAEKAVNSLKKVWK